MFTRKLAISAVLIGMTVFTFASIGGGRNKSPKSKLSAGYTPVRTSQGFSLRSNLNYKGSMIIAEERTKNYLSFNSLITYSKGNMTYILPNKYKIAASCQHSGKNNLQLLNVKINLSK
jgi:hypothetical protein